MHVILYTNMYVYILYMYIGNIKQDLKEILTENKPQILTGTGTGASTGTVDANHSDNYDSDIADMLDDCREVLESLRDYFTLADPGDVRLARDIVYK